MIVLDIVTGSLRQIGIIGETKTPSAEQGADAVTRLNDLMASMEEDEIYLGWNPKSTTADTVVLPLGHVETIKALLAVILAGSYGVEPPAITVVNANQGYKRLLRGAIQDAMTEAQTDAPYGDAQILPFNIYTRN